VLTRAVSLDGRALRIGGVGGVMTRPLARGRGHASAAWWHAAALLGVEPDCAFALLVCPTARAAFYARRGWRPFDGRLLIAQPGGTLPLAINAALVLPLHGPTARMGTLDLCGLPW